MPPSLLRWPTETPEGRSIAILAKEKYGLRGRRRSMRSQPRLFLSARQTRMSGVDISAEGTLPPSEHTKRGGGVDPRRLSNNRRGNSPLPSDKTAEEGQSQRRNSLWWLRRMARFSA